MVVIPIMSCLYCRWFWKCWDTSWQFWEHCGTTLKYTKSVQHWSPVNWNPSCVHFLIGNSVTSIWLLEIFLTTPATWQHISEPEKPYRFKFLSVCVILVVQFHIYIYNKKFNKIQKYQTIHNKILVMFLWTVRASKPPFSVSEFAAMLPWGCSVSKLSSTKEISKKFARMNDEMITGVHCKMHNLFGSPTFNEAFLPFQPFT